MTVGPLQQENRRARIAVALLFLTNGAVPANLVPLFPSIKSGLGLSNAEFGFAIAAGPIGALSSGLLAGLLIRRFRSSRVAVSGMIAASLCALLAGVAPSWVWLAAALFLLGAMDSVADVAQNSHGLRVQRRYGRSILNSFHAIWSVGAVLGALMGGAAAGLGVPVAVHLSISAAIFATVNLVGYRFLLPGPEPAQVEAPVVDATGAGGAAGGGGTTIRLATWATLLALGLLAICGSIVEDSGGTWSAVYLSGSLGAGATVAAFGFVALAGMQFVGRILAIAWSTDSGSGRWPARVGPSPPSEWAWRWRFRRFRGPSSVSAPLVSGSPPWCRRRCTPPTNYRDFAPAPASPC